MNDTTKTCPKCDNTYPATTEYFSVDSRSKSGLQSYCKVCNRAYRLANQDKIQKYQHVYRLANADRLRKLNRKYYQSIRDIRHEKDRAYRLANQDKIQKYQHVYRLANRDTIREYQRVYNQANLDKKRIWDSRRRARKRALATTFTEQQWLICLEYHHYCCAVCGKQLRDLLGEIESHADHWIPLNSELCTGTVATNMICLCSTCNHSKNDKMPDIWLKEKYGTRKANEILKRIRTYFEYVRVIDDKFERGIP